MDEEDEKKKKSSWTQKLGSGLGSIVQIIKYLSNPIIRYIIYAIAIIIFLVGLWGFFKSIPGNILGWIANRIFDFIKEDNSLFKVEEQEIIDLCNYLEEMGYDLEGYGFVEKIERGPYANSDNETFTDNEPKRGEILSVQSKYLEAYIIAERKSYIIAQQNKEKSTSVLELEYIKNCADIAISDVISEYVKKEGIMHYQKIIDEFFERTGSGEYKLKSSYKSSVVSFIGSTYTVGTRTLSNGMIIQNGDAVQNDGNALVEKFDNKDIITKIEEMLTVYYRTILYSKDNVQKYSDLNQDLSSDYSKDIEDWDVVIELLRERSLADLLTNNNAEMQYMLLRAEENVTLRMAYARVGAGLIYLEDAELADGGVKYYFKNIFNPSNRVEIDKEHRMFIVETPYDSAVERILGKSSKYGFDLNEWTCKYGKPVEFLISVHAATQAPDFAYRLATDTQVDARVHVAAMESKIQLNFVDGDMSNKKVLDLIEEADKNEEYLEHYNTADNRTKIANAYYEYLTAEGNDTEFLYWWQNIRSHDSDLVNTIEGIIHNKELREEYKNYCRTERNAMIYVLERAKTLTEFFETIDKKIPGNAGIVESVGGIGIFETNANDNAIIKFKETRDDIASDKDVEKIITLSGDMLLSYHDIYDDDGIKKGIEELEGKIHATAIPYITKVTNHWYRNQYFTGLDLNVDEVKQRLNNMLKNIYRYMALLETDDDDDTILSDYRYSEAGIETYSSMAFGDASRIISTLKEEDIEDFDKFLTIDNNGKLGGTLGKEIERGKSSSYFKNIYKSMNLSKSEIEAIESKVNNEIRAVAKEIAEFSGSVYSVTSNTKIWYPVPEDFKSGTEEGSAADEFIKSLYIKETRSGDLVQKHNPLFEDNSQYIRSWLRDKYYIFNGKTETDDENESPSGNTVGVAFSDKKIAQEKQYINGKTALEMIEAELEECTDRANMVYMLRDLKELFEDFEFDLENTEVPTSKFLSNVMPSYKPYTPWPSAYETVDPTCTKMIYKGGSALLGAPANGIVTRAESGENGIIEIQFTDDDEETSATDEMTFCIRVEDGSISAGVRPGEKVKRGDQIGSISGSNGVTIAKLYLFSATKQKLKVEDYMQVDHYTYDTLGGEAGMLSSLIDAEAGGLSNRNKYAVVNVVLNRISSPYFINERSISDVLGSTESARKAGFYKYSGGSSGGSSANDAIIAGVFYGSDVTRAGTLVGATNHFYTDDAVYDVLDKEDKEKVLKTREKLRIKMEIEDEIYGITKEEYEGTDEETEEHGKYAGVFGDMLEKKLDEVFYTLNISKYVNGIQEFIEDENLSAFDSAKQEIKQYYLDGTFLEECGGIGGGSIVTNLIKTIVYTEEKTSSEKAGEEGETNEEEEITAGEGEKVYIDHFTLVANDNYVVNWTFEYKVGVDGLIASDIKVDHEAIKNY